MKNTKNTNAQTIKNTKNTSEKMEEKTMTIMERLEKVAAAAQNADAATIAAAIRAARAAFDAEKDAAQKAEYAAIIDTLKETYHAQKAAERDAAQKAAAAARIEKFNNSRRGKAAQKAAQKAAAGHKAETIRNAAQKAAAERAAERDAAAAQKAAADVWKKNGGRIDAATLGKMRTDAAAQKAATDAQKAARIEQINVERPQIEKIMDWSTWTERPEENAAAVLVWEDRRRHEIRSMIQHVIRVYDALGRRAGDLYAVADASPVLKTDGNGYDTKQTLDDIISAAWLYLEKEKQSSEDIPFRVALYAAAAAAVENIFNEYRGTPKQKEKTDGTPLTTIDGNEIDADGTRTAFLPHARFNVLSAVIWGDVIAAAAADSKEDAALIAALIDGYNMTECAELLGVSRKTIYTKRLPRIRARLQDYSRDGYGDLLTALFTSTAPVMRHA